MSAENQLAVFPMVNGEIWIVVQAAMDHNAAGSILGVVAKTAGYEAAREALHRLKDEESPDYYYTEYGYGHFPTADELKRMPVGYPKSVIRVHVIGRSCACATSRDLSRKRWVVEEDACGMHASRQLASGVTYAEAITIANQHATWSPGVHDVWAPHRFVRSFVQSRCDCCLSYQMCKTLTAVDDYSDRFRWY